MAKKVEIKKGPEKAEERQISELKNQLARALADYDNLRKRIEREKEDLAKIASIGIIVRLLPVLDNLESAQVHLQDQGLAISLGEFKKILNEEGLIELKPDRESDFNENEMEVIEVVPGERDNKVAEVVLTGWKFADGTIVRPAKVKVERSETEEKEIAEDNSKVVN